MTHICVGKLTIIGSDNGLSPERRQAIIWTNDGIFLIGPLGTNFSEISIGIQTFSFKKMHLKMSSATWRLFGLGLNELLCCCVERGYLGPVSLITNQRYRKSHTKLKSTKCIFCGWWVQNFMWTFEISHKILNPYTANYAFYDVLKIWRLMIS